MNEQEIELEGARYRPLLRACALVWEYQAIQYGDRVIGIPLEAYTGICDALRALGWPDPDEAEG